MIILAYIILAFTVIQMFVALMNLLPGTYLPKAGENSGELVSVLIPARNEENNIGNILQDLLIQEYQNIEIIVFDDQSEDKTSEIVNGLSAVDYRIRLVCSEGLPEGWLGKNFACHSLSKHAKGDYLMFLDADVRIKNNIVGKAVSFSKRHGLALISIFPKQIIKSYGERVTVPNMNYILLSLLPLILVRKSKFTSLSAANGQFMFFKADVYHSVDPHWFMKSNKVEDISISKYLKEKDHKIACLVGDDNINCRMYTGFCNAVSGFSKNVIAFFGNSFLFAVIFWLVTTFGFIPVWFFLSSETFLAYLTVYLLTRIFVSLASHQNIIDNFGFIVPLQISMGIFIYKAFINKYFRKYQWKGRNIE
ncbi:MAG: glycosyltransferase family 2 protein [Bacteroidia bacterium]|nr:glycosyltransferase family 2 protein [Bacteroidia bacterium]